MGLTKTEGYSKEQILIASQLKALAHPARIAILQQIIQLNTCICNDLVEELPLAQASVSQHLKALKEAGIIAGSISGTSMCYCINQENWKQLQEATDNLFSSVSCGDNCC